MSLLKRAAASLGWRLYYAAKGPRRAWARFASRSAPLDRELLSYRFIRGEGIEIGALNAPLPVRPGAKVRYVDRMADLDSQYPELGGKMVKVDIVDNGETLATVPDGSQDFVIANHFLEHCQDPIATLANLTRVLRPGGVLYMAVPEKRFTFDHRRPPTPLEHLIRDHEEGPEVSRLGHFEEFTRLVHDIRGEEAVAEHVRTLVEKDYSIHFHVWTQLEFLDLVRYAMQRYTMQLEAFVQNGIECVTVLRKIPDWEPVTSGAVPAEATA